MGFAIAQIQFLSLTRRKADYEYGLSRDAMQKMILAREMNQLTRDYNSKISQKQVVYYADGKYNKVNYRYLMGAGPATAEDIRQNQNIQKSNCNMVLTDPQGHVVLSECYARVIRAVCGISNGEPFSENYIPDILEAICSGSPTAAEFRDGIASHTWSATATSPVTGESTQVEIDTTDEANEIVQRLLDFFLPIVKAASVNGWTTEYNANMAQNEDYLTNALTSGSLVLAETNEYGYYDENASLTYFAIAGDVELRSDSDKRKEIERWYLDEQERISEKETFIDMDMQDLNTQLEAIKAEIESVKSIIQDATQSIFNWGGG